MITGLQRQGAVAGALLELASDIHWDDPAIDWTGQEPDDPIAAFEQVLRWDGSGDGQNLVAPVWSEHHFKAGRLGTRWALACWDLILRGHPNERFVKENLTGMRPSRYFQHFRGRFMGQDYDCDYPPPREFANHWPCEAVSTGQTTEDWVWEKIQADLLSGAVRRVQEKPRVVLPLSVEPEKPR